MTGSSSNPPRISRGPEAATEQFAVPYPEHFEAAGQAPPPVVIRRARPNVFVPPQPQDHGQVISRGVGRKTAQPKIPRNRKIAGNLPAWDPLPPGEIHAIHRGGSSSQ